MSAAKELVIWDCDGCLVDSEALLKTAEVEALHAAGFKDMTEDDCNRLFSGCAQGWRLGTSVTPSGPQSVEERGLHYT